MRIFFLSLNNMDVKFVELVEKFILRSYTIIETLSTTQQVEVNNKRKFIKAALDKNFKTFIMYIAIIKVSNMISTYLSKTFQV